MKFLDLFSGIGGARRGMELAGHECIGFVEYDKHAVASYTMMHLATDEQIEYIKNIPQKDRKNEILKEEYRNGEWFHNDITTLRAEEIPRADCWCFGAPCQSFSIAGRREGLDGESGLVREVFRLLNETREEDRPEWLVYENVKGMLSSNRGMDFFAILSEMDRGGTMSNGNYSTLNTTEYRKTGSVCTLSDILEEEVSEKYFLSKDAMEKIVLQ